MAPSKKMQPVGIADGVNTKLLGFTEEETELDRAILAQKEAAQTVASALNNIAGAIHRLCDLAQAEHKK